MEEDKEDVPYDLESLFTNIPVKETIDYIIDAIYMKKNLTPICTKLIFKRSLFKLSPEHKLSFSNSLYLQSHEYTMGGPLFVTFSDI